jgi:hypothetical protein
MTLADDPCIPPRDKQVSAMTTEELVTLFDWYDFRDPYGHPLTKCSDFIELINRAVNQQTRDL